MRSAVPAGTPLDRSLSRIRDAAYWMWARHLASLPRPDRVVQMFNSETGEIREVTVPARGWLARARRIADELGYAGHWLTKSPTVGTFGALREQRRQWAREALDLADDAGPDLIWEFWCWEDELLTRIVAEQMGVLINDVGVPDEVVPPDPPPD